MQYLSSFLFSFSFLNFLSIYLFYFYWTEIKINFLIVNISSSKYCVKLDLNPTGLIFKSIARSMVINYNGPKLTCFVLNHQFICLTHLYLSHEPMDLILAKMGTLEQKSKQTILKNLLLVGLVRVCVLPIDEKGTERRKSGGTKGICDQ